MDIRVRDVLLDDAREICAILNAIIDDGSYTSMTGKQTVFGQRRFMRSLPRRSSYLAAVSAHTGRVLGVQDVLPSRPEQPFRHVGEISTFVCLEHTGMGVGRALFRETVSRLGTLGYRKLIAMVRGDNAGAQSYYAHLGFRHIGILRDHLDLGVAFVDEWIYEYHHERDR
jgi:L-amino acid N-acyltransferase YncA